jgi:predicted Zn-dependent peptidase
MFKEKFQKMNKVIFSILILVFTISVNAQVDRTKAPEAGPAPEVKIGDYQSFELKNGLKVFVIENHKIPVVSYSLSLDNDPVLEGKKAGYVGMTGELLRAGTTNRSKDEIDESIDFIGASLSTSASGIYGRSLKKHTEELLDIMSDILYNPAFPQEELEKSKKQWITGLKSQENEPKAIAANVASVLLYGKNHPYGELETEESINNITVNDCKTYYNTYFSPNVAYLIIVGDISLKEAKEEVNKYFSQWEAKEVPKHKYEFPKGYDTPKVAVSNRDGAKQSVIEVTYAVDLEPGSEDAIPAKVMNYVLGGGSFSSRLMQNIREDKGYTYGAYSSLRSDELVGKFTASASVRNVVTDSALVQVLMEMNRIRTEKVPEEDLQMMKNVLTGSFSRSLEDPQTVARFALNTAKYNLPKDYYHTYLKKLNAVTSDDVLNIAKKYIRPENAIILAVGDVSQIKDGMKQFSPTGEVDEYDFFGEPVKSSPIPEGLTAQNVIDDYITARGGKENMEKINDITSSATASIQGMELKIKAFKKAPNKICVETYMGPNLLSKQVCDGVAAKVSSPQGEQILEGELLDQMKYDAILFPELEYQKEGYSLELMGAEDLEGEQTYKVKVTNPAGKEQILFFSKNTGLIVKETSSTPQGSAISLMHEYTEINGVKFPSKVSQSMGPQMIEIIVDEIEVNKGIDDSKFEI